MTCDGWLGPAAVSNAMVNLRIILQASNDAGTVQSKELILDF